MMGRIYAIALNTFREAIRNKVLYGIIAVVFGANCFALVLGQMSLNEEARFARDMGLAGISLFGSITAIALGVTLLYGEIQRKTIHNILSKPILRFEFVLGKYLGMAFTLTLLVICFSLALAVLLSVVSALYPYAEVGFTAAIFKAVLLGFMEVLIVAAVAIFFSSFTTPYLSGIFTFGVFFLGRISDEMRAAASAAKDETMRAVAEFGTRVIPDLHIYAISGGQVDAQHVSVHGNFVTWSYMGAAAIHALAWIALLLLLSSLIFRRRDFA